jgi:hypothetical protein
MPGLKILEEVGMVIPASGLKVGGELGWSGASKRFEDLNYNGSGFAGGVSAQFTFPIGGGTYAGLNVSVLGSNISGTTTRSPRKSNCSRRSRASSA